MFISIIFVILLLNHNCIVNCNAALNLPKINSCPTHQIKVKTYGLKQSRTLIAIKNLFIAYMFLILLLAGDIELNPGPVCVYKKTTELFKNNYRKLKFLHVNCHSIVSKKKQIDNLIEDLGNNTVYGFCETWLKEEDSEDYWKLKKDLFETFRSDRRIAIKKKGPKNGSDKNMALKEKGGGVMLVIPKSLNPKLRKDLNNLDKNLFESLWVECNLNNNTADKSKQLINISYNPKKSLMNPFLEQLSTSIDYAVTENKALTLMGDYNIDYLNWKEKQCLDSITIPYGLNVVNNSHPTWVQGNANSLIDYIITDLPQAENYEPIVSDAPLRTVKKKDIDHLATSIITSIDMNTRSKVTTKEVFDKTNYSKEVFREAISNSDWTNFYNQDCGEGMFTIFCDIIEKALHKCTRKKTVFIRNDKSVLTIHNKWVTTQTRNIYSKICPKMNPNDPAYKTLKHDFLDNINADKLEHQIKYFNGLTSEKDKWNLINESRNAKRTATTISSLKNSFGDIVTGDLRIANLLNYRFSKLGDYLGEQRPYTSLRKTIKIKDEFTFQPISLFECKKQIKNLNINKPLGPSKIPAWALKDSINVISEPLTFLINAFITEGKFPNHLKQAYVTPIFKKGDCEEPNNYRPISITPALSKIFEKIMRDQITFYLNKNNILSSTQFGFRSKFSSADALLHATENIRKKLNDNEYVAAAFLDLSKAFDSISHSIMLDKLHDLNFDKKAVSMIESFLKHRNQKVILNTCKSDWIELYQGVPQGTVLGPLLFNIYVNDMSKAISNDCELLQYADDTMTYASHKDENQAIQRLENDVNHLVHFFESHGLTINADKTEFIIFCKQSRNAHVKDKELKVKNTIIKSKSFVKYLGVFLDQNLNYQNEVKNILKKMACGIKTLYALRESFPQKTLILLMNALVISHVNYSAILLSGISDNLITTLEKQLSWAVKACFNRKKFDHSADLKVQYNILPIRYFLNYKSALYFWKFTHNMLPSLANENRPSTAVLRNHKRTNQVYINIKNNSQFIKNGFFNKAVPIWNTLPENVKTKEHTYHTTKTKMKQFFLQKFKNETDIPEFNKRCWKDFRFL